MQPKILKINIYEKYDDYEEERTGENDIEKYEYYFSLDKKYLYLKYETEIFYRTYTYY